MSEKPSPFELTTEQLIDSYSRYFKESGESRKYLPLDFIQQEIPKKVTQEGLWVVSSGKHFLNRLDEQLHDKFPHLPLEKLNSFESIHELIVKGYFPKMLFWTKDCQYTKDNVVKIYKGEIPPFLRSFLSSVQAHQLSSSQYFKSEVKMFYDAKKFETKTYKLKK